MNILTPKQANSITPKVGADGVVSTASVNEKPFDPLAEGMAIAEQASPSAQYETFAPKSLGDEASILSGEGGAGAQFGRTFAEEGVVGRWFMPASDKSPEQAERDNMIADRWASENPFSAFVVDMGAEILTNAPTEIAVALTGTTAASVIKKMATAANAGRAITTAARGVTKIEQAYDGVGGNIASRMATRGLVEATGGMASAYLDEKLKEANGAYVTTGELVDRLVMEGTASVVFSELIRGAVKGGARIKDIVRSVNRSSDPRINVDESHIADIVESGDAVRADASRPEVEPNQSRASEAEEALNLATDDGALEVEGTPNEAKRPKDKTLFVKEGFGGLTFNGEFKGTVRDMVEQINELPDYVRNKPNVKILNSLTDRIREISEKVSPDRTALDDLPDVKVEAMSPWDEFLYDGAAGIAWSNPWLERQISDRVKMKLRDAKYSVSYAVDVLAHEFAHVATVTEMNYRFHQLVNAVGSDLEPSGYLKDVDVTRDILDRAGVPKDDPLRRLNEAFHAASFEVNPKAYGMTDMFEFISEALANDDFRDALSKVKMPNADGTPSTLLDRIMDAVGDLLGFTREEKTAFSEVVSSVDQLLQSLGREGTPSGGKDKGPKIETSKAPPVDSGAKPPKPPKEPPVDSGAKPPKPPKPPKEPPVDGGPDAPDSPDEPKPPTEEELRITKAAEKFDKEMDEINEVAKGSEGLSSGSGIAKVGGFIRSMRDKLPAFATTDNLAVANMLKMMGKAGEMLKSELVEGTDKQSRLWLSMQPAIAKAEAIATANRKLFRTPVDVTLEVATEFGKKNSATAGVMRTLKMTPMQKVALYMKAMDGFQRDLDAPVLKNSTQKGLYKKEGGFELNGEVFSITKEQLAEIQTGGFLTAKEMELANATFDSYRAMVDGANAETRSLIGMDVMNAENYYYNPKHLSKENDRSMDLFGRLTAAISGSDKAKILGSLKERKATGNAPVKLIDPLVAVKSYQHTVSNAIGYAKFGAKLDGFSAENGRAIQENYGKNWASTLSDYRDTFAGDSQALGRGDRIVSTLLSLRAQSILGYNPFVALKQTGSAWSAAATGMIGKGKGLKMVKDTLAFVTTKTDEREAIVAEMLENSPFYKQRSESGKINIDIGDLADNLSEGQSVTDIPRRVLDKMGLGDLVDKIGKAKEGTALKDGMEMIKRMDEATMAAVWKQTKDHLFGSDGPKTPEDWAELNRVFTDVSIDSQPTYSMGSRTLNQMKRNISAKMFTQFSSQTAKNFGIAYRGTLELANSSRTPEDFAAWGEAVIPLLIQNAQIAAITLLGQQTTSVVRENVFGGDENRRSRMEKKFDTVTQRFLVEYLNGAVGQVPGSGPILKQITSGVVGAPVYDLGAPILSELGALSSGLSDRKVARMAKAVLQLSGAPMYPIRLTGV